MTRGSNIVGEPLDPFVFDEIKHRQEWQYSGFDSSRTEEQIQYLNNKDSWIKLGSSVEVGLENLQTTASEASLGLGRLKSLGFPKPEDFMGTELAEKFILFNGVSEVGNPNSRMGIADNTNLWNNNSSYGLGGSEFGLVPTPGVISMNVDCMNRGSIRKANIQIVAHNKFQFELIEMLYLRIGFHVLLEWGNDRYYDGDNYSNIQNTLMEDFWFNPTNTSQLEVLGKIKEYREKYKGNYDGFFGRVSNFEWRFNNDGTYDIDLQLITVGDVIESLQVNLPSNVKQQVILYNSSSNDEDSTKLNEDLENVLDDWLFGQIPENTNNEGELNDDYYFINEPFDREDENVVELIKTNQKYQYYVRLGKLLSVIEELTIPIITGRDNNPERMLTINNSDSLLMSYNLNQTPLDPRVCIFKAELSDPTLEGISPLTLFSKLRQFIVKDENFTFGLLSNIYLNFNFVKTTLRSNTDKTGKLSLYKFLSAICDGINKSLGGVNKLEPVILEDKTVTIIDQNPIPGLIENIQPNNKDIIPLNIYANNPITNQSTFVTDINLNTKLTPDFASMVSIGATAAGSNTKGMDSTMFSKWNAGLADRFALNTTFPKAPSNLTQREEQQKVKEFGEKWDSIVTTKDAKRVIKKLGNYIWAAIKSHGPQGVFAGANFAEADYKNSSITDGTSPFEEKYIGTGGHDGIASGKYNKKEYVEERLKLYNIKLQDQLKKSEIGQIVQSSYVAYLAEAFGSYKNLLVGNNISFPPIEREKAKYFHFDVDFINKAQSTYKQYLDYANSISQEKSREDAKKVESIYQSNQIGFIPISLGITLDGMSGIKIYNKLEIDQSFLPQNYPKSIHFIVTKVNHTLNNNKWETQLETISVPVTKYLKKYPLVAPEFEAGNYYSNVQGVKPLNERGPEPSTSALRKQSLRFIENRNYIKTGRVVSEGSLIGYRRILPDIHPDARNTFEYFFKELEETYKGYYITLNSTGRSIEKSIELYEKDNKNAKPGRSLHNYNASIDINLTDRVTGKTLLKETTKTSKADWINSGLPDIAKKYGIGWGGDFSNYWDPVHFYFDIESRGSNMDYVYDQFTQSEEMHPDVFKIKLIP